MKWNTFSPQTEDQEWRREPWKTELQEDSPVFGCFSLQRSWDFTVHVTSWHFQRFYILHLAVFSQPPARSNTSALFPPLMRLQEPIGLNWNWKTNLFFLLNWTYILNIWNIFVSHFIDFHSLFPFIHGQHAPPLKTLIINLCIFNFFIMLSKCTTYYITLHLRLPVCSLSCFLPFWLYYLTYMQPAVLRSILIIIIII